MHTLKESAAYGSVDGVVCYYTLRDLGFHISSWSKMIPRLVRMVVVVVVVLGAKNSKSGGVHWRLDTLVDCFSSTLPPSQLRLSSDHFLLLLSLFILP